MEKEAYNGARIDLVEMANTDLSGKTVFDFGCYRGANAAYLKAHFENIEYIGFELDQWAIENKYPEVDRIFSLDLDEFSSEKIDYSGIADVIILGDVVEHLKSPEKFLNNLKTFMNKDSQILVSVPNVQYYETFFLLLLGRFPRRKRGIFDSTHLRWFTNKEFQILVENDFEITKMTRSYRLVEGEYLGGINRLSKVLMPLMILLSPFFTFQLKYILKKKS